MAVTFFWRCESTTLSTPDDDYSAGDETPTNSGSAEISSAQARVGTNSILVDGIGENYNFASASIATPAEGAAAFSFYLNNFNAGALLFVLTDASEGNNHIRVALSGTDEISLLISRHLANSDSIVTTDANLATATWYGCVIRWHAANQDIRLEIYDASDVLRGTPAEDLAATADAFPQAADIDIFKIGDEGAANPDCYIDNVFIADSYSEPLEDNFTISAFSDYGGASPTTELENYKEYIRN